MRALVLLVGLLLPEAAKASCFFEDPSELRAPEIIHLDAPERAEIRAAPPGGLWWLARLIDDNGATCTNVTFTDADGEVIDLEVVREGPLMLALRVPLSLQPGDVLEGTALCFGTELTSAGRLEVTGGAPPQRAPPELTLAEPEVFEWIEPACNDAGQNSPDNRRFAGLLDLTTETSGDSVLLDVWLLTPDEPLPDESAPRAVDKMPTSSGTRTVLVRAIGSFDVHVRITDPETAESSELLFERVAVPGSEVVGCSSSGAAAAPLGLLLFLLRKGRARKRRE